MPSSFVIFGQPHTGKTQLAFKLQKALKCKYIAFDYVISYIAEYTRHFLESKSLPNAIVYFPENTFPSDSHINEFVKSVDNLVVNNLNTFRKIYGKHIRDKIPNKEYRPGIDNADELINLGRIGDSIEQFADAIVNMFINSIINQEFFITEGYYFNKNKPYRRAIQNVCETINFLECRKGVHSSYIINDKYFLDILKLEGLGKSRKPRKKYQAFHEKEDGDSLSYSKIKKLGIPKNLSNKVVLDIGCNEGFYCFECERRGAKVVGIEKNIIWYSLALERRNEFSSFVNFVNMDWNDLSTLNYKFDLVLFLAAFHYLKNNQHDFLSKIYEKMNNGGLLILEAGIIDKKETEFYIEEIKRPSGEVCQYPNKYTLERLLNEAGFLNIVFHGDGYKVGGDSVPRFVIHALKD